MPRNCNALSLRFVFALCGILLMAAFTLNAAQDRPNVLFIAIDDLNDWIGATAGIHRPKRPIWTS